MRIFVTYTMAYRYEPPANGVIQLLRLTPRDHEGQYVVRWRIDLSQDCRLDRQEDAFGNIVHAFTLPGPLDELGVQVEGEVQTQDTAGIVRGAVERFPPSLFLRETALTAPDAKITAFAAQIAAEEANALERMHRLLMALHRDIALDPDPPPTQPHATAAEAFSLRRGTCQDLTHIFLATARSLQIPARYISGHMRRADGVAEQRAGHAWAEAHLPGLGWVGFDPTNGLCTTDAHVRVAAGLDGLGAAPVRGARHGGADETLTVNIRVDQAQIHAQS